MDGEEKEKLLGDEEAAEADNGDDEETPPGRNGFGGAKPKVRNSEETPKRKRRVLKKAHSVSHSPQRTLEPAHAAKRKLSVSAIPSSPRDVEVTPESKTPAKGRCAEFFGVKSYLHTFYEHVSIRNPSLYEDFDEEGEYRYLIGPRKRRRAVCWKITLWAGVNLLAFGLVMILVGYMVPRREVVIDQDEDTEVVDRTAVKFNSNLDLCKIVGLVVFCVGGTVLVGVLLFPSLLNQPVDDGSEEFKVQVGGPDIPPSSPTEKKVPVTEELTSVQPKRGEKEEGLVMTNTGLCKVP